VTAALPGENRLKLRVPVRAGGNRVGVVHSGRAFAPPLPAHIKSPVPVPNACAGRLERLEAMRGRVATRNRKGGLGVYQRADNRWAARYRKLKAEISRISLYQSMWFDTDLRDAYSATKRAIRQADCFRVGRLTQAQSAVRVHSFRPWSCASASLTQWP
jgi:hypothetical protein